METTAPESNTSNSYIQSAQSTINSITSTIYNHPATEKIANLASSTGEQIKEFVDRTFVSDEEAVGGTTPGFEGPGSFPSVAKPVISNEEKPSEAENNVEGNEAKVTSEPQNVSALETAPALSENQHGFASADTAPALGNNQHELTASGTTPTPSDNQHGFTTLDTTPAPTDNQHGSTTLDTNPAPTDNQHEIATSNTTPAPTDNQHESTTSETIPAPTDNQHGFTTLGTTPSQSDSQHEFKTLEATPALSDNQHGFAKITQSPQNTQDSKDKAIPTGFGVGTDGKGERDPAKTNPRAWAYDPAFNSSEKEYKTSWGETLKMGSGEGRGADTVKLGELEDTNQDQQASSSSSESEEDENSPRHSKTQEIPARGSEDTERTSSSSSDGEHKKGVKEKKPKFGKLKAKLKKVF